jgi:ribosomal protein L7/L12
MSLTPGQKEELLGLVRAGQKIIAVKRYREITGVGLQEALYAVTRLADVEASGGGTRTEAAPSSASSPTIDPKRLKEAEAAAMAALRDNNVMEAIKRYRQHTRLGLKEAKDAVDVLSVVHRSNGRLNAKVAHAVMEKVFAGRKEEALTLLMSNAGYDDTEARALIKNIGNMRLSASSCAGGCLRAIILLALLAALAGFGMKQLGLF